MGAMCPTWQEGHEFMSARQGMLTICQTEGDTYARPMGQGVMASIRE